MSSENTYMDGWHKEYAENVKHYAHLYRENGNRKTGGPYDRFMDIIWHDLLRSGAAVDRELAAIETDVRLEVIRQQERGE